MPKRTDPMDDLRRASAEVSDVQVLSPAAQAVLDAVEDHSQFSYRRLAATALRALVDQDETLFDVEDELVPAIRAVRTDRILALAAELEGAQ